MQGKGKWAVRRGGPKIFLVKIFASKIFLPKIFSPKNIFAKNILAKNIVEKNILSKIFSKKTHKKYFQKKILMPNIFPKKKVGAKPPLLPAGPRLISSDSEISAQLTIYYVINMQYNNIISGRLRVKYATKHLVMKSVSVNTGKH